MVMSCLGRPFREFQFFMYGEIMEVSDNNCTRVNLRCVIISRTCLLTRKASKQKDRRYFFCAYVNRGFIVKSNTHNSLGTHHNFFFFK